MSRKPTKLVQSDSRDDTNEQDQSCDQHSPELNLQHILVVVGLSCSSNSCQHQEQNHITTKTVVLVKFLGVVDTAVELRDKVLRDTDHRLEGREDVCEQAKDGMRRFKVCSIVADLVVLDHDQSGDGCQECDIVESRVCVCAFLLLLSGVSGLDNENTLNEEEEGGGIEEL